MIPPGTWPAWMMKQTSHKACSTWENALAALHQFLHFGCLQELVPLQTDLASNVKGKLNSVTGQVQVKDGCLLKNISANKSLEWLWRGQNGYACTAVLSCQFLPCHGEWGLRFAPTGRGGVYPEHPALYDKTNHAAHSSIQSQHRQPSQSVSCLSHPVSHHFSLPGYLNWRD